MSISPLISSPGIHTPKEIPSPYIFAYLMLQEAVVTLNQVLKTSGHLINENCSKLRDLLNRLRGWQSKDVPDEVLNHHRDHHKWYHPHFHHGLLTLYSTNFTHHTTVANMDDIIGAQGHNDQVAAERLHLNTIFGVTQQQGKNVDTDLSSKANSESQSSREATALLQTLLFLTYKALQRRQPQV